MSDQLPSLDPPTHTAHRGLLMRLITPKRLKENEASMCQMADHLLDDFLVGGEGEYIKEFAGPFALPRGVRPDRRPLLDGAGVRGPRRPRGGGGLRVTPCPEGTITAS